MQIKDLENLLESRASHRKFLPDPIPEEDIRQLIECARLAPSGHNFQPWKFVAVTNKDIIIRMSQGIEANLQSLSQTLPAEAVEKLESYKFFIKHFENAPVVIAVFAREYEYISSKLETEYNGKMPATHLFNMTLLGVGGAINNLLLAAETLGYGSCWMTEPVVYGQEVIEKILQVEQPYRFVSLIALGKPVKAKKGQERKPVDDLLTILR